MTRLLRGSIRDIRSVLYRSARLLGDAQAVLGGPNRIIRRIGRRIVGRWLGKLMRAIFG